MSAKTPEQVPAIKGETAPFSEALYHSICPNCRETLFWEAEFDADGTSYHARCCKHQYWMKTHTVEFDCVESVDE